MTLLAAPLSMLAAPAGNPSLVFHSTAYTEVGEDNQFSFLIGTTSPTTFTVVDGLGEREIDLGAVVVEDGEFSGTWYSFKAPQSGEIKLWGDASKIDAIIADGAYITSLDMSACTDLDVLSLEHNALQQLDLSNFTKLSAIYLSDNPFTEATPLVIGSNKPNLQILEIDIIDWMDQNFNLSDYPAMVAFDAYHNMTLYNVDPTGCPQLAVLSVEMCPVSTLDVTKNPELLRLNIAETRITNIDLSQNTKLEHLIATHDSGAINCDYYLNGLDVSNNPNLTILNANGNNLTSINLSQNAKLTNLSLNRNKLTQLDLSGNPELYSIYVINNDLDYATLPWPQETWGEYFYSQNPLPVDRAVKVGSTVDLSSRVLRENTQTLARVWRQVYDNESELLDESLYSYADGKITFNTALTDSVYVEFYNDVFSDYNLTTTKFRVRSAEDYGKPSKIASFISSSYGEISFAVGMLGATAIEPKTFYVDFGDGTLVEQKAVSARMPEINVTGQVIGQISIYIPEGEVMTALDVSNQPLASVDVTAATELEDLCLSGCGFYNIDLKYNRCLQWLDVSHNNLSTLDLQGVYGDYEKNVLNVINASDNKLTSFEIIATRAAKSLNMANNLFEEFVLNNYDNLEVLDLSGNKLTSADLEYLAAAVTVNLSNNSLTSFSPCPSAVTENLDLRNNNLTYPALPLPSEMGSNYLYAPQKLVTIPTQAPTVNLSSLAGTVGGNPTVFVWKKIDGTTLAAGQDYTINNGVTSFTDSSLGDVYCEISNATFPAMTGDDVLRTTTTHVIGRPTNVVASFRTVSANGVPNVIFAATEPLQLYIDWKGDDNLISYDVETSYISYDVDDRVKDNTLVKIYAVNPDDAAKINVFSIYDMKLREVDLSALTGVFSLNLGNTDLTPDDVTMPVAPGLSEMNLSGNRFTSFPYAEKYPNIYSLNISDNLLTEFDGSQLSNLGNLIISKNSIKTVSFDNPGLWSIYADNNQLESVDLSGLPALGQLLLNSNMLKNIDLEPVKNTLYAISLVDNRFLFSTLPLPSAYPNLSVYFYGNQYPMEIALVNNNQVDLSSQLNIGGVQTLFTWYLGLPSVNEDSGELEGISLVEGEDYTMENGVTTFLKGWSEYVYCFMTNDNFPNLTQYTYGVSTAHIGVDGISTDGADAEVAVYSVDGAFIKSAPRSEATDGLAPGLYIIGGVKTLVK